MFALGKFVDIKQLFQFRSSEKHKIYISKYKLNCSLICNYSVYVAAGAERSRADRLQNQDGEVKMFPLVAQGRWSIGKSV